MSAVKDQTGIQRALHAVRAARYAALCAFEDEFPDLYRLSAAAFEQPFDSISHRLRVAEFLTEWDNGLGRSPLECLAAGHVGSVNAVLSARAELSTGADEDHV